MRLTVQSHIVSINSSFSPKMRRVAQNMMPEALLTFGLSEAIQDFCDSINESNILKFKYTQIGLQQPLEKSIEIILYRISQELCNNLIKHAAANSIFIQITKHQRRITLTVEDDIKGFDTPITKQQRGWFTECAIKSRIFKRKFYHRVGHKQRNFYLYRTTGYLNKFAKFYDTIKH